MKERPILFNGPMVRALLDGSKTQTRRIMREQVCAPGVVQIARPGYCEIINEHGVHIPGFHCPFGQPGDRLWVRESFWGCDRPGHGDQPCVVYDDEWHGKDYRPTVARPLARKFGRIPSIHMPRDCSRITLEITGVRVERLNSISEADARSEGITDGGCLNCGNPEPCGCDFPTPSARDSFVRLWESTGGDWHANPWVWVIDFRRVA